MRCSHLPDSFAKGTKSASWSRSSSRASLLLNALLTPCCFPFELILALRDSFPCRIAGLIRVRQPFVPQLQRRVQIASTLQQWFRGLLPLTQLIAFPDGFVQLTRRGCSGFCVRCQFLFGSVQRLRRDAYVSLDAQFDIAKPPRVAGNNLRQFQVRSPFGCGIACVRCQSQIVVRLCEIAGQPAEFGEPLRDFLPLLQFSFESRDGAGGCTLRGFGFGASVIRQRLTAFELCFERTHRPAFFIAAFVDGLRHRFKAFCSR